MYIVFIIILALACAASGVMFIKVTEQGEDVKAVLFKGITTVCVIVIAAISTLRTDNTAFAKLILLGLFFGFVGDELLALRFVFTEKFNLCFLTGAGAFLIGHIFYLLALYGIAPKAWIAAVPLLIGALALELRNSNKHNLDMGKMFIPLAVYAALVCFMGCSAVGSALFKFSLGTLLFAVAGVCFIVSDSILSVQCFSDHPSNGKNRSLHAFYWGAQLLIALSPLFI